MIMHNCSCCSACQYDLDTLRAKHHSLLIDYPILKDKMLLACQTQQLYRRENAELNTTSLQQKLRIQQLEQQLMQLQQTHSQQPSNLEDERGRREANKIDELNRILHSKNSELAAMKQELLRKNEEVGFFRRENELLRQKVRELGESRKTETGLKDSEQREETTISTSKEEQDRGTSSQRREIYTFRGCQTTKAQASPSPSRLVRQHTPERRGLGLVEHRIFLLQRQNERLREKLMTRI